MPVSRDYYFKLASEVPSERLEAASGLISDLTKENKKEEWDYALNRLVKGLSSTRQSARVGFSMALTEVAREMINSKESGFSITSYLSLVKQCSEVRSSMKGKEERAALFGRLFGFQALLNSEVLFEKKHFDEDCVKEFVSDLIDLAVSKSWIRETSIYTLCQLVQRLKTSYEGEEIYYHILEKLHSAGVNSTVEGVAVYLSLDVETCRQFFERSNISGGWKNGDPLYSGNLQLLAKVLKDSEPVELAEEGDDETGKKKKSMKKSNWSPRLHFVWYILLEYFVKNSQNDHSQVHSKDTKKTSKHESTSKKRKLTFPSRVSLTEFWKIVVDETLFANKSSPERKYWGFEVFMKFLSELSSEQAYNLFTPNLMRCLVNQASQPDRMLNKLSTKVIRTITETASNDPKKVSVLIKCLTDNSLHGSWNFDLLTKSKCIDSLISSFNSKETTEETLTAFDNTKSVILDMFVSLSQEGNDDDDSSDGKEKAQRWYLDKILAFVRNNKRFIEKSEKTKSSISDIVKLLVSYGFFERPEKGIVSSNLRNVCKERLVSILSEVLGFNKIDFSLWIIKDILKNIKHMEKSSKYKNCIEFDEELDNVKSGITSKLSEIANSRNEKNKSYLFTFELIYSLVVFQIYLENEEAVTIVNELDLCYDQLSNSDGDLAEDPSIILTEIVLSFVSQKSGLLKKISFIIWESLLCSKDESGRVLLNTASLKLLYDVLEARENKEGQQSLFEGNDEFEEDVSGSEKSTNEAEEDSGDESDSNTDESGESDVEDEDDDKNIEDVDKNTNFKLAEALGIPIDGSNEVKFDEIDSAGSDSDDSYESESMDDDQMMAIDDQLSKIFKERRNALSGVQTGNKRKEEVRDAKEHMSFFKSRILDLLAIFAKMYPNSHMNLTMIKPLVNLIQLTLDKDLGTKAHKIIKTQISKTRAPWDDVKLYFEDDLDTYAQQLLDTIEWLHKSANAPKKSNQAYYLACNQSSIIAAKNLLMLDKKYLDSIIDLYSESMKKWALSNKSGMQPSMFFDFINWVNTIRGK
ncbi:Piso0_005314 [Millerozyma farinosa CBS 7064]|uniref:Piso0_005314 protein n=1 Tax=Pichia sorbitophila (strain ATCC MYA-4447 / BCRC 22081 / CBS 7064 / NBRC 10061 / NRRL Y-12695) TaxID=559304 RepID=G8Y1U8_PICSO|nr:Piso0_005314 [Millerozyma farinosa CBS 7064]